MFEFEWNQDKAQANLSKHHISFDEASTAFGDPLSLTIPDPENSKGEFRYLLLGQSSFDHLLVVSFTEREERIRIISARLANKKERNDYEKY